MSASSGQADRAAVTKMTPTISIVVPTFNEAHNLSQLVERLDRTMRGIAWEVVFVDDDSPDKTWKIAQQMALRDGRVRCIRRVGRRGLAGACIEGMLSSAALYVAVMDGDLQHDEAILPDLLSILERDEADVAIGSRHIDGEAGDSGFSARRAFASRFATRLASVVIGKDVSDPMSGFFAVRREVFESAAPMLLPSGFKILLDLLASADRPLRVKEVGYRFRTRQQGQSKFDAKAVLDFLALLIHRWTRGVVPIRFLFFAIVGAIGIGVHLTVLRLALVLVGMSFGQAQTVATFVAMTSNFFVNNLFTYRDKRLRGLSMISGLLLFYAVCGIGAFANVGVASFLFAEDNTWWLASITGIIVGTAFNYTMSSIFVWRHPT